MKTLLIAGLLVAAVPLHGLYQTTNASDFSLSSFEQKLQQDLTALENLFAHQDATPAAINQQMNQVLSDMQQLNQVLVVRNSLQQRGLHKLPHQGNYGQQTVSNGVAIAAGDRRVSKQTLQAASQIVERIALPILKQNVGTIPAQGTKLVLFSSKQTYGQALLRAGVPKNQINAVVTNTGGLTIGNDVWIPLYNLQDKADLANVLTHEMTHVVFNQKGSGEQLPTWVNEGMAWHDGMLALQQASAAKAQQEAAQENSQIEQAKARGQLLPLSASEDDILHAPYNVEWTDYLAVQNLIAKNGGVAKFNSFLNGIARHGVDGSFQVVYGESMATYENHFLQAL